MATPTGFVLPQLGIFAQGTAAYHFLEFDLRRGAPATTSCWRACSAAAATGSRIG